MSSLHLHAGPVCLLVCLCVYVFVGVPPTLTGVGGPSLVSCLVRSVHFVREETGGYGEVLLNEAPIHSPGTRTCTSSLAQTPISILLLPGAAPSLG